MRRMNVIHIMLTGVLMLVLLLGPALADQNYYVNADSGHNGMLHSGSKLDPWQTITHALGRTTGYGSSGNPLIIHVAAATAHYDVALGEQFPLQVGSYTSLVGDGRVGTIIDAASAQATVIRIRFQHYASVGGFTVENGLPTGDGIGAGLLCVSTDHVTITGCLVTVNNGIDKGGGIYFDTCSNITVESCLVTNNRLGGEGIDAEGAGIYMNNCGSDVLIEDCVISGGGVKQGSDTHTLQGAGVACYGTAPVFSGCQIEDNTAAGDGAGIYMEDCPDGVLLEDCDIKSNVSTVANPYGCAGLECESSDYVTMTGCSVANNEGFDGGGILFDACTNLTIESCQVTDNNVGGLDAIHTADALGAGIGLNNCGSDVVIDDCEISGNHYVEYTNSLSGAGVYCYKTSPVFTGCRIESNSSYGTYGYGGGIYMGYCSIAVLIEDCEITGNKNNGGGGGGFAARYSSAAFTNTHINSNASATDTWAGGGEVIHSTVELDDCEMNDNTSSDGGAVWMSDSSVTFRGATISGNKASTAGGNQRGGGVHCDANCTLTIENSTLEGNEAGTHGGAAYILQWASWSNVTITGTEILNNKADVGGGGITVVANYVAYPIGDNVKIEHCTITGNECTGTNKNYGGGGIECNTYSSPTILNCLIAKNSMSAYSASAGVNCRNLSSPKLVNCTIADNQGHGVYAVDSGCVPTLTNCILWNNNDDLVNIGCSQISHCDIKDGDCSSDPHVNLNRNPLFVPRDPADPENKYTGYYLAHRAAQAADSPCLSAGDDQASAYGLDAYTTCTDGSYDEGTVDIGYHYSGAYGGSDDTYIELASFEAKASGRSILISWETGTEINNAGFDLYRVEAGDRTTPRRMNERMIPAKGSPAAGASYEFIDSDVRPGVAYSYYLVDIDTSGKMTLHGPVSARVLGRPVVIPDERIGPRVSDPPAALHVMSFMQRFWPVL